ncbi:hypothetical protein K8I85_05585, partial [bacterium]|nr:hypothetical protein [bacterium]
VLTRCVFSGNRAWGGGAVALGNEPEVTLIDCLFENNHAVARGGAINLDQDPPIIHFTGCTFVHNRAPLGGHMYIGINCLATVGSSILGRYCQAPTAVQVASAATGFEIDCSVIQGGAAEIAGSTFIVYGPDNVDGDPLFCGSDPDSCDSGVWPTADYTLDSMSPAAPSWHPCGLAGAYPVACGVTSAGAEMESSTWGRIKDRYRGGSSAE